MMEAAADRPRSLSSTVTGQNQSMAHTSVILQEWQTFNECLSPDDQPYLLSGRKLSLGAVIAVSKSVGQEPLHHNV